MGRSLEGSGEMLFTQVAGQRKQRGERGGIRGTKGSVCGNDLPGATTASPLMVSGESAYTFHIWEDGLREMKPFSQEHVVNKLSWLLHCSALSPTHPAARPAWFWSLYQVLYFLLLCWNLVQFHIVFWKPDRFVVPEAVSCRVLLYLHMCKPCAAKALNLSIAW